MIRILALSNLQTKGERRMKKRFAALLIGTMLVSSLTGCTGNSSPGTTEATTVNESKTEKAGGNVTYWTWQTQAGEAEAKQVEYVQSSNPNLKLNIEYTANADYWTKLPVAIAGGTGPDIYLMTRPSFELYAASGQMMDISDIVANSPALSEYMENLRPELQETYKFDGGLMAIPITVESTAIAYNRDAFKAAGLKDLKEIEDTWTWDDFADIARQLTIKGNNGEGEQYGCWIASDRIPFWEKLWSAGYEMFDEKQETCLIGQTGIVEAYQPLVDLYQEGMSPNSVDVPDSSYGDDLFISGKIAMIPAGIWKVPSYANITTFDWDVAQLPLDPTTGKRVSSSNVLGLCINPNSKNLEATIAALEKLVQPDCMKIYADMGVFVPALESVRDGFFTMDTPQNIAAYKKALDYVHPNTLTQYIPYQQFGTLQNNALKNALSGKMTLEDALKEANEEINKVMDENKAQFNQ